MASHDRLTLDGVLAGFDEHLRRTRGVCRDKAQLRQVCAGVPAESVRRRSGGRREDPPA